MEGCRHTNYSCPFSLWVDDRSLIQNEQMDWILMIEHQPP
uniref:Uncharacterized protein n=1 Tax=Arundo donax TaxID=35708 RepID=A0A0A9AA20_ARUDO